MRRIVDSAVTIATYATLLLTGSGCGGHSVPSPAGHDCRIYDNYEVRVPGDGCHSPSCGGNSPVVNTFKFNGLHPDGCANADNVSLDRDSLDITETACRTQHDKLYLDYEEVDGTPMGAGYALVARPAMPSMSTKCSGAKLVGATFTVTKHRHLLRDITYRLRISGIGKISVKPTYKLRAPDTSSSEAASEPTRMPDATRLGYLITPADQPAHSLCMSLPPEVSSSKSTPILQQPIVPSSSSESHPGIPGIFPEDLPLYALIVPGAVYDSRANLLERSTDPSPWHNEGSSGTWFNIACAGDALAQTELTGLATKPITGKESAEDRRPALHMLTAKYCNGWSATTRGTPIEWRDGNHVSDPNFKFDTIEAQWNKEGATCAYHSRLWMIDKTISLPAQLSDLFDSRKATYPMKNEQEFLGYLCSPETVHVCKHSDSVLESYPVFHVD